MADKLVIERVFEAPKEKVSGGAGARDGFPSRQAGSGGLWYRSYLGQAWIMYAGTAYEHLMIPVK